MHRVCDLLSQFAHKGWGKQVRSPAASWALAEASDAELEGTLLKPTQLKNREAVPYVNINSVCSKKKKKKETFIK